MTPKTQIGITETRTFRTFDDLTEAEIEFQAGRIAKVRGRRPTDLDGWELINLTHALGRLLFQRIPPAAPPDTRSPEDKEYDDWQTMEANCGR